MLNRDRRSKSANEVDHFDLLVAGDLRKHWQRHDFLLVGISVRKLLRPMLEAAIGLEERQSGRIIHHRLYAMVSSGILLQVLMNVPLTTSLLTNGAAFLFVLWYVTPRDAFVRAEHPMMSSSPDQTMRVVE